jgi:single-strand selective monofunctional uracil DNA glycosylase
MLRFLLPPFIVIGVRMDHLIAASDNSLIRAAKRLARETDKLIFSAPVEFVYNPLSYAWEMHEEYLSRYCLGSKKVVFIGMNPGPFGMAQTGVPFGQIAAVRDWLGIRGSVGKPRKEHPNRPVSGFACLRSEVSGQRLWGLFADRFGKAERFFADHVVMNYCPLVFMEASGKNRTPDKLARGDKTRLFGLCDEHLRAIVAALKPEWLIAIGGFAGQRTEEIFGAGNIKLGRILHPSPANPTANQNWALHVTLQLEKLGVWKKSGRANDSMPGISVSLNRK